MQKRIISFPVKVCLILFMTGIICTKDYAQVKDVFAPLQPGAVKLNGYLENDIQNSIIHWNKGVVPYSGFVEIFRKGREFFAQGEMWGKAVRSGCMFYRYSHDPELKNGLPAHRPPALQDQHRA